MVRDHKRILRVPNHKQLKKLDLRGKRVLLRLDLNVPIKDGEVLDDKRVTAATPTVKKIIERGAEEINIITHLGRPKDQESDLSTLHIAPLIKKIIRSRQEIKTIETDYKSPALNKYYSLSDKVNLFENLRYDPREEKNSRAFAKELSALGEVFVLDAFANIHREHTSMSVLQDVMTTYAGLLMEREINNLYKLISSPKRPFVSVIGGAKIEDKMPVIESLSAKCEAVLVGGKTANEMILQDKRKKENIFLPVDGISQLGSIVPMDKKRIERGVYDIGPQTIMQFKSILASAKTIFVNGNLGKTEEKKFIHGTNEVLRYISKHKADKVASGGNTADVIDDLGLNDGFDFISTGGGATSDLLAGKDLPVLKKLLR